MQHSRELILDTNHSSHAITAVGLDQTAANAWATWKEGLLLAAVTGQRCLLFVIYRL